MTKIAIVIGMVVVALSATFCAPQFFGSNKFLSAFITFELLNILAVILTVTLASIANIHLSLNRIVRAAFKDKTKGKARADAVRREINQNGWLLLWLFIVACCLVFLKGGLDDNDIRGFSFVHSIGLVLLLTSLLVLCDIYQVIYAIVRIDTSGPESEESA